MGRGTGGGGGAIVTIRKISFHVSEPDRIRKPENEITPGDESGAGSF